jgi:hypothetical protein
VRRMTMRRVGMMTTKTPPTLRDLASTERTAPAGPTLGARVEWTFRLRSELPAP